MIDFHIESRPISIFVCLGAASWLIFEYSPFSYPSLAWKTGITLARLQNKLAAFRTSAFSQIFIFCPLSIILHQHICYSGCLPGWAYFFSLEWRNVLSKYEEEFSHALKSHVFKKKKNLLNPDWVIKFYWRWEKHLCSWVFQPLEMHLESRLTPLLTCGQWPGVGYTLTGRHYTFRVPIQ
jgi:hypothetical protein